jgi:hypothetical protein
MNLMAGVRWSLTMKVCMGNNEEERQHGRQITSTLTISTHNSRMHGLGLHPCCFASPLASLASQHLREQRISREGFHYTIIGNMHLWAALTYTFSTSTFSR